MILALIHLKLCRKFQLSQLLFSRDIIVTMSLFFIVSIFIAFRINGIKKDRLNNFRCGLRRMSSNSLVYHIYRNEGDLRHTFEHLVLRTVVAYMQWLLGRFTRESLRVPRAKYQLHSLLFIRSAFIQIHDNFTFLH